MAKTNNIKLDIKYSSLENAKENDRFIYLDIPWGAIKKWNNINQETPQMFVEHINMSIPASVIRVKPSDRIENNMRLKSCEILKSFKRAKGRRNHKVFDAQDYQLGVLKSEIFLFDEVDEINGVWKKPRASGG